MPASIFTDDFKAQSFWWDTTPDIEQDEQALPEYVDVLIIGSGYTGLSAALQTARAGRSTVVVDARTIGWGCSSRNGGQVSNSLKPDYQKLVKKVGAGMAKAILKEGLTSLEYIESFIEKEDLDCDWKRSGRFVGAHNKQAFKRLLAKGENLARERDISFRRVLPGETRTEAGTDFYLGGFVYPDIGALHPGKYIAGLAGIVREAGAQLHERAAVTGIERHKQGFVVNTEKGRIRARDVVVATNGYTDKLFPQLRRRVIPIGSYMIATEPIPHDLMRELLPRQRMMVDTRRLVYYYRACPEGERILFGGRVALAEIDPLKSAPKLHQAMCRIFPQLREARISHAWMGLVAYTFDEMPHLGRQDGIFYAMGYCGSGISLSSYFGMKIGQQVLGNKQGQTPLTNIRFPTRPYYFSRPWFLGPSILYYRVLDRLPI